MAEEFLAHARAIRAERAAAEREGRPANVLDLLRGWGGSTICYRRRLIDSPSYTLNHEEVAKALEEGIRFAEGLTPLEVVVDEHGWAKALMVSLDRPRRGRRGVRDRAGAAGAHHPGRRRHPPEHGAGPRGRDPRRDRGRYFQAVSLAGQPVTPEQVTKPSKVEVLASVEADGRAVSFFGDLHPSYAGNVVKAMASAKQGYPVISELTGAPHARSRRPMRCSPAGR